MNIDPKMENHERYLYHVFETYYCNGIESKKRKEIETRVAFRRYAEEQNKKKQQQKIDDEKNMWKKLMLPEIKKPHPQSKVPLGMIDEEYPEPN